MSESIFLVGDVVKWTDQVFQLDLAKDYPKGQLEVVTTMAKSSEIRPGSQHFFPSVSEKSTSDVPPQWVVVKTRCCSHVLHNQQGLTTLFRSDWFRKVS